MINRKKKRSSYWGTPIDGPPPPEPRAAPGLFLAALSDLCELQPWEVHICYEYILEYCDITLWLFNIAMGNDPFIDGLPIKNGDFPWLC